MKIFFLNPPFHNRFSRESRSPAVTKSDTLYYPKWLCMAAAYAEKNGHEIYVYDAPAEETDIIQTIDKIKKFSPSLVVIDTSTPSCINDYLVNDEIKNQLNLRTILVGRHVSALPEHALENSTADFVALKEYEKTISELALSLEKGIDPSNIKGIAYREFSTSKIIKTEPQSIIENLDEIPWVTPIYKRFLPIDKYYYGHSLKPIVVLDTSRGCPYHCSFCVYPQTFSGHRVRFRSINDVVAEFNWISKNMPNVKTIMLEDDTFIVNKKRTEELADALILAKNKLPFDSNCRVDIGVDLEFLKKLKMAGARLFCVGFESGSNTVIKHMIKNNKKNQDEQYISTARNFSNLCNKAGIMVHGCFMIGNLNETKETLKETLQFALSLPIDTAQFFPIMVYPGTTAFKEAKERNLLKSEKFELWLTKDGLHDSVVNLPSLTSEELVEFADLARRKFYLRPSYLYKKLLQSIFNYNEFERNFKGFKKLLKFLITGTPR